MKYTEVNGVKVYKNERIENQSLTDKSFWEGNIRFENCSFKSTYIGPARDVPKSEKRSFDLSHVKFVNCDLEYCNFKHCIGLKPENFIHPGNVALAKGLPTRVCNRFIGTGRWYDDKTLAYYRKNQDVINNQVTSSGKRLSDITNFFLPRDERGSGNNSAHVTQKKL